MSVTIPKLPNKGGPSDAFIQDALYLHRPWGFVWRLWLGAIVVSALLVGWTVLRLSSMPTRPPCQSVHVDRN